MPYQLYKHEDYIEVRLEGVLDSAAIRADDDLATLAPNSRVLVDYGGVTDIVANTYQLVAQAKLRESLGLKVALYAPRPALFGLNRQVLQLADVREGISANVFSNLEEAQAWLRSG